MLHLHSPPPPSPQPFGHLARCMSRHPPPAPPPTPPHTPSLHTYTHYYPTSIRLQGKLHVLIALWHTLKATSSRMHKWPKQAKICQQIELCIDSWPWCRPNVGLVIEGAALATALLKHNAQPFLGLCQACQGVVCCRVTPMQKAQVVALVKKTGAITLGELSQAMVQHALT